MTVAQHPVLSTAIVGCGVIGRTHADAVGDMPTLVTTALVDPEPDRARALADHIADSGAPRPATFASIAELIATGAMTDLVAIATPSGMHVEQAIAALEAGAHVIIEKPLDVDLVRARRMAQVARDASARGQVASVISQHRFDPASLVVSEAVRSGGLGRITSAVATVPWWRSQEYYDSGTWRGTWALDGGGALMNQGVHTLDLLIWLLGRPVSVSAEFALLAHENVEVEDTLVATLRFESGALATFHASTAGYPGLPTRLQVLGTNGSAVIAADDLEYIHVGGEAEAGPMGLLGGGNQRDRHGVTGDEAGGPVDATQFPAGHARQYQDIVDAIANDRPPALTVDDAVLALATVRAIYASAVTGTKLLLSDVLAGDYDDVALIVPNTKARP